MTTDTVTMTVDAADAGARIDSWLAARIPLSRSRIQKLIRSGDITVNGKAVTPHAALEEGDVVTLPGPATKEPGPPTLLPRTDIPLDIVHEDDDVMVIAKPSGLLMHPSPIMEDDTLANALVGLRPSIADAGEDPMRPGIMHRLDKDASGLVVIAKTRRAFDALKQQFKARSVKKEYLVLVAGRPPEDEGVIDLPIGRSASGTKMAARRDALPGDRAAVTRYRTEELFDGAALLRVRTETGRTHQIRTHLRALGCPVAGDPLYGRRKGKTPRTPRLFLHADTLEFAHPSTGERMRFTLPLPEDLAQALDALRSEH